MCLGIPMRVTKIRDQFALVNTGGLTRQVNIQMVPRVKVDDYVIVHVGFAIQIINPEAARETLSLIEKIE